MSFRLKTILGVGVIEAVLLMILIWSSLDYLVRSNQEELTRRAVTTSQLFASMTKDAVLSTDLATLESAIEEILKSPGVIYVRIWDQQKVVAQGGAAQSLQKQFVADQSFELSDDGVFDIAADISEDNYIYGRVELGVSVAQMALLIKDARNRFIAIAIIEMLLVAFFSYVLGSYLSRGLKKLSKAAQALRQGALGTQISMRGNDELATTAYAFNDMSARLQQSHNKMQRSMEESEELASRLQKSELRLRTILRSVVDGIITINDKGIIDDINRAGADTFGYQKQELIGKNVSCLMPEPYHSQHDSYINNYFTTGNPKVIGVGREVYGLRKDGATFPLDLSVSEMEIDGQRVFVGLVRDISERRKIESKARKSEAIKSAVIESSLDGLITINRAGEVVDFSPAAEKIFGYQRDKILGQPMNELIIPPAFREAHSNGMRHYFETGDGPVIGNRIEVTAMRYDASEFPAELTISAIKVDSETMFTAFLRDISARKDAEAELEDARHKAEAASEAKSRFLAHMSHEIRSPLNAVLGSLGLLMDSQLDEEQRIYTRTSQTSGKALLAVINDILDFSKIEAGQFDLEETVFNMQELLVSVGEVVSYHVQDKDVDIVSIVGKDIPLELIGDPTRLHQVLLNLMDNAVKFTQHGAVVLSVERIPTKNSGIGLRFVVEDSGTGIPDSEQSRLFDEFSQVDNSDATRHGGTGLGLAICGKLVDLMGGNIQVDSELGRGSRFIIDLELAIAHPDVASIFNDNLDYKVLVIGSSVLLRNSLRSQFTALGCQTVVVATSREMLEKMKGGYPEHFDFVFIDETLGDIDLGVLTQRFHSVGYDKLILMTALPPSEARQKERQYSFDKVLPKPINIDSILSIINEVVVDKDPTLEIKMNHSNMSEKMLGKHILLVEDSPANQMVATALLRAVGCEIDVAQNGIEAIEAFNENSYDLILMDLRMPEMDGLEATKRIRKTDNGKDIPIVAMTANAMKSDIDRCLNAGMNDYITKPVDRNVLLRVITKWVHSDSLPECSDNNSQCIDVDNTLMDPDILKRLEQDTSVEMVPTMIKMFIEEVESRVERIDQGVSKLSLDELCDEAHTIKSIAGTFGAISLSELARDMELSCREERRDDAEHLAIKMPELSRQTILMYRKLI